MSEELRIALDDDGFMLAPGEWNAQVAAFLAQSEGIAEITEKHWAVIHFIREYYAEHQLAPPVRLLCQQTGMTLREMYKLFTSGPARGACRVAGLPKPDGCV